GLSAQSTNGAVSINADVTQVSLETTNGQIDATLRPTASGRIGAETTNGLVEIGLKDGDLGPCPQGSQYYTPPCNERTFKTHGFDQRAIQEIVSATGTNGRIVVDAM